MSRSAPNGEALPVGRVGGALVSNRATAKRLLAWLGGALIVAAVALLAAAWFVGGHLCAPVRRVVGPPPASFAAETVRFRSPSGTELVGWWRAGQSGRGAVILMHGFGADRRIMLGRAGFFSGRGMGVLLFDLEAHGESGGDRVTFGLRESGDAAAAVNWVRQRAPGERIGAIGSSLGAAALALGETTHTVDALVLECMFPTIGEAVSNRLAIYLGPAGRLLTPLLTVQVPLRMGCAVADLSPVTAVRGVRCPVMILGGKKDRHTPPEETRRIFEAAPEPKELWLVEGAAHVDLRDHAKEEYERRVGSFMERHLNRSATGATTGS